MPLNVSKIIQYNLPESNYYKEEKNKSIIVIHHTAGNSNAINVIDDWKTRKDRVATSFVISGKPKSGEKYKDGDIYQTFGSKYWANHLGLMPKHFAAFGLPFKQLNNISIGIEICNWGWVKKDINGIFRTYVNTAISADEVVELETEFRGYKFYHKYTEAQLQSLKDLLVYLCDKYVISKTYHNNMFEMNKEALSGVSGIWSHTSYRPASDKQDCSPQPQLINILKNL